MWIYQWVYDFVRQDVQLSIVWSTIFQGRSRREERWSTVTKIFDQLRTWKIVYFGVPIAPLIDSENHKEIHWLEFLDSL